MVAQGRVRVSAVARLIGLWTGYISIRVRAEARARGTQAWYVETRVMVLKAE